MVPGDQPRRGEVPLPAGGEIPRPLLLKAGEKKAHTVELPQYVGAVRVMLVAGDGSAYGSAEKSVFVRQALMILPTLPRVIGPGEQFSLPVSVFTSEAGIKTVELQVQTDARFTADTPRTSLAFTRPEEKLGFLSLKAGTQLGKGKIKVIATSGKYRAESDVWLEIRTPNVASSRFQRGAIEPGASWTADLKSFRARRHAERAARSVGAAAHQPRRTVAIPHQLSAWLSRADHLGGLPTAVPLGADQARPEPAAADREQHPRGYRETAQPPAFQRRVCLLARRLGSGSRQR